MNLITYLRNSFLTLFGDIKVFKFPLFILYDPGSYKVKGNDVRKVIETVQKGDILIRGFSNYLDGYFIPGTFSHAGLYLGETHKGDDPMPEVIEKRFHEGKQTVIHAMAEGVFMEDVINFCRCDYLLILRRNKRTEPQLDLEEDFDHIYYHAIKNLGKGYDFSFDFENSDDLSCTELVYECAKHYLYHYNVKIREKKVFGFIKKKLLIPDDFVTEQFDIVFQSKSLSDKKVNKIIKYNASRE